MDDAELTPEKLFKLDCAYRRFVKSNILWTAVGATFLGYFGLIKDLPSRKLDDILGVVQIGFFLSFLSALLLFLANRAVLVWNTVLGTVGGIAWLVVAYVLMERSATWQLTAGFAGLGVWWLYWALRNARAFVGWGRLQEARRGALPPANH